MKITNRFIVWCILSAIIIGLLTSLCYGHRMAAGTTDQFVYFIAVDSTDLKTRETGFSSFTVYYSINSGAGTAMTSPTIAETDQTNMPGVYDLLIDEAGMTTLTAGDDTHELCLHITHAGMDPVTRVIEVYRPETTEGGTLTISGGVGEADVKKMNGATDSAVNLDTFWDDSGTFAVIEDLFDGTKVSIANLYSDPLAKGEIADEVVTHIDANSTRLDYIDANLVLIDTVVDTLAVELAETDVNVAAIDAVDEGSIADEVVAHIDANSSIHTHLDYIDANMTLVDTVVDLLAVELAEVDANLVLIDTVVDTLAVELAETDVNVAAITAVDEGSIADEVVTHMDANSTDLNTIITNTTGLGTAVSTTIASATNEQIFVLTAGKTSINAYLYHVITVTDADDSNVENRLIVGYTAGRQIMTDRPFSFEPTAADVATISMGTYFKPTTGRYID